MAGLVPFDWTTAQNALHTWLYGQLAVPVWWESQHHPRDDYPYATLNIIAGPIQVGELEQRREYEDAPGTGVKIVTVGNYDMTVACKALVSHDSDSEIDFDSSARALLSIAHMSLGRDDVVEDLNSAGIGIREALPIRDLTAISDSSVVDRAVFDLQCRLAMVADPDTFGTSIGTVYVSSDMDGQSGSGDLDLMDEPFGG